MMPAASIDAVMCPRCDAPVGKPCVLQSPTDIPRRTGVHYARWTLALGLDHDPGDEDRS